MTKLMMMMSVAARASVVGAGGASIRWLEILKQMIGVGR
jgi:hypothetical protein